MDSIFKVLSKSLKSSRKTGLCLVYFINFSNALTLFLLEIFCKNLQIDTIFIFRIFSRLVQGGEFDSASINLPISGKLRISSTTLECQSSSANRNFSGSSLQFFSLLQKCSELQGIYLFWNNFHGCMYFTYCVYSEP